MAKRLIKNNKPVNAVVRAYAGTGKTFSLIMGVANAYAKDRWKDIVRGLAKHKGIPTRGFKITPSEEQQAIWDHMASIPDVKTITYCAFNRSIVEEFNTEWGWLVKLLEEVGIKLEFRTINSLGSRSVYDSYGFCGVTSNYAEELLSQVMGRDLAELRDKEPNVVKAVNQLVALCKLNLIGWYEDGFKSYMIVDEEIQELADYYDIDLENDADKVLSLVPRVLAKAVQVDKNRMIDYNDQNWIPIVNNLPIKKVDLVLVDEAQDLPRCKQEFVRKLGRNVICVGDIWQAIYGFAGADVDSIPRMEELLGVESHLSLTETRRCSRMVVEEAKKIVPDFKAHESNSQGKILSRSYQTSETNSEGSYVSMVRDGDMCLCRVNAPLISQALKFIKSGRKALIRGRDFGKSLITFINNFKAQSVEELIEKVDNWHDMTIKREMKKKFPNEAKILSITDRKDCILAFTEDAISILDVVQNINLVFAGKQCPSCLRNYGEDVDRCMNKQCKTEKDPAGGKYPVGPKLVTPSGVVFSSIHRAKGLEADRVFLLQPKGAEIPHPMAKTAWQKAQERNLLYVAITRAKNELVYVR